MPPIWIRLETPAFGHAKGEILKADLADSRATSNGWQVQFGSGAYEFRWRDA
jgi:hypothetical protein